MFSVFKYLYQTVLNILGNYFHCEGTCLLQSFDMIYFHRAHESAFLTSLAFLKRPCLLLLLLLPISLRGTF